MIDFLRKKGLNLKMTIDLNKVHIIPLILIKNGNLNLED